MTTPDIIGALFVGFLFGSLLQLSGLTHYEKIVNVFRLTDLAVLKFMLSALVTGAVLVYAMRDLGWVKLTPNPTYVLGNLVGGLIFGVGMASAGFCPGTCVSGSGRGNLDYMIPGFLGFMSGAALYGRLYDKVFPSISSVWNIGSKTLPEVLHVNHWLFIVFFVEITLLLFYAIERAGWERRDRLQEMDKER